MKKKEKLKSKVQEKKKDALISDDGASAIAELVNAMAKMPKSKPMQFPIEVSKIEAADLKNVKPSIGHSIGAYVAVRPCDPKHGNNTYLGVLLGDMPLGFDIRYNRETKVLSVSAGYHNPAMYVPELKEIIYGCGSWWSEIKKPEDLKQITDLDINSVWYVQLLKAMGEKYAGKVE